MKVVFHKDRREGGYVLLALLLSVSLLSISLLAMIGRIEVQIKRDREKELIHRGLEYSRAVRRYVKMFGRYPNSVEQLENSNNIRFLRKRYKDPITGKDFNLLHYGDLETFNASGASVSATSGASPKPRILIAEDTTAVVVPEGRQTEEAIDTQGVPVSNPINTSQTASNQVETATELPPVEADSSGASEDTGGIAIIGVASFSRSKSIRVFNNKDHYNQWQFVYDPSTDSGMMTSPNRPLLSRPVNSESPQGGQSSTQNSETNLGQK